MYLHLPAPEMEGLGSYPLSGVSTRDACNDLIMLRDYGLPQPNTCRRHREL